LSTETNNDSFKTNVLAEVKKSQNKLKIIKKASKRKLDVKNAAKKKIVKRGK